MQIIINATPVEQVKYRGIPLPYEHFTAHHIAFDLIYNLQKRSF
jgi:shikimate 5-dehydrogenase